jgi:broad specificity phosphatase PhoE
VSIFLVRHGQTNGNRDRIVQTPQTPLSTLGHQQAKLMSEAFSDISISKIICSDYTRTQQTAEPLRIANPTIFTLEPLLRERSFGDLRGLAYKDIDADFFNHNYAPPNGETHQQFARRVSHAWDFILNTYDNVEGNLVVMTHGLVLRELVEQYLHLDANVLQLSDFQNTCITEVSGEDKKTVLRWCDALHLDDSSVEGAAV